MTIDEPSSNGYAARHAFYSATAAIALSTIEWLGMPERQLTYLDAIPGLKIVEALFTLPGGMFAAAVAMVVSPQGVHGVDQLAWLIWPANLVIYFTIFYFLFSRLARRRVAHP